jgi:hypothetical protein
MNGKAVLENARRYRTIASLYRQTAAFCPDQKWSLLAQAFEYERLARMELEPSLTTGQDGTCLRLRDGCQKQGRAFANKRARYSSMVSLCSPRRRERARSTSPCSSLRTRLGGDETSEMGPYRKSRSTSYPQLIWIDQVPACLPQ